VKVQTLFISSLYCNMEPGETAIAREQLGKKVSVALATQTTMEELLKAGFSVQSTPRSDFDLTWCRSREQQWGYLQASGHPLRK
jgi:hypothetical protein